MSDTINDGGPAFPCEVGPGPDGGFQSGNERWTVPGMALRDYFAAKAMHQFLHGAVLPPEFDATEALATVAARAYEAADAMLKAKETK